VEQYLEKVQLFREIVPQITLGTDIIVGFPTETEDEFMETYKLLELLEFSVAFLFAYSPRKGTPAMRWQDDISEDVKQDRLKRLMDLQEGINMRYRQQMLGKQVEVLVEKRNFKDDTLLKGRTRCWKNVLFRGDESLIGTMQQVNVHSYSHQTLLGDRVIK
jgi:tRNA-2-methylthio-N6-dimethylallyladenosine synthase